MFKKLKNSTMSNNNNVDNKLLPLLIMYFLIFISAGLNAQSEIKIGRQIWMKHNLNVDRFRDGTKIFQAKSNSDWYMAGDNKQPAWCYYYDDNIYEKVYGKLYNGYAVSNSKSLCPKGWHIPTLMDWKELINTLGGIDKAGGKLRSQTLSTRSSIIDFLIEIADNLSIGNFKYPYTSGWDPPNSGATNSSKFSAFPGGLRWANGEFTLMGLDAFFWSSSKNMEDDLWFCRLQGDRDFTTILYLKMNDGLSVRCLKD
jgi:uncharacterized protein (TIGR02145 family)